MAERFLQKAERFLQRGKSEKRCVEKKASFSFVVLLLSVGRVGLLVVVWTVYASPLTAWMGPRFFL
ncbi:MAG TPA: hypothetical protein VJ521_01870 [Acidobacteriota bacterium]|nr:hypothetical protein [Acidobacteriota bacterium]